MGMKFTNNAATTLAANVVPADLTMQVNLTAGSTFPVLAGGDYFYCTLQSQTVKTTVEVVKVTAVVGTVFTMTRAQDGTAAQVFSIGDSVELRLVAAALNDVPKLDEANVFTQPMTTAALTATGVLTAQAAVVAQAALTAQQGVSFGDGTKILSSQINFSAVRNLIGSPNTATPLTKYDLTADSVVVRAATGLLAQLSAPGLLTCNLGLAGPAANGRDQVAAFGVNTWVYLYYIWNAATLTLSTLASTLTPANFTGATLPAGYTHWAFATALRWNAVSNIIPANTRGCVVEYDSDPSVIRALTSGGATVFTAVSLVNFVPPIAARGLVNWYLSINSSTVGTFVCTYRPTGSNKNGIAIASVVIQVAGTTAETLNTVEHAFGASQSVDYKLGGIPTTGGVYLDVLGYIVPNGDS